MIPANEFWLSVHQLAESIEAEGLTGDERSDNIIRQLVRMPHIAQRQVLTDLHRITGYCPDLYPLAVAAANENEQNAIAFGRAS